MAQRYQFDVEETAAHLEWPVVKVQAALQYAEPFPEQIQLAIEDNRDVDLNTLKRMLPGLMSVAGRTKRSARK